MDEMNVNETPVTEDTPVQETTEYSFTDTSSTKPESNGNIGYSIASMVCGILSILCCCFTYLGLIAAIAAIALGIVSLKKNADGRGMAIAGLITGGIGALLAVAMIILGAIGVAAGEGSEMYNEIMDSLDL